MSENQAISISAKLKEAGRHSIVYGLGSVVQSAAGLVLLPILTGSLSKNDFGAYSLILMASSIASAVFYFGMTSALPRSYFDFESAEDRRAVFTTAFLILAIGAILQSLVGWHYADTISTFLVRDSSYAEAVAWSMFGAAVGFVNQYFFGYLRLLRKSTAAVLFSLISFSVVLGFTLYLLALTPGSVVAPFEAIAYSQLLVFFVFIIAYGKAAFGTKLSTQEIPKLLYFGIASIAASFGSMAVDWPDRLIIERYMTLADVGIYSAALRVGGLVNVMFILPFTQIWSPMMMEYRKKTNVNQLFTNVLSAFLMIGGGITVFASLFGQDLLPLLIRSDFSGVTIMVFVLAVVGAVIYGLSNIVAAGLFYERKVHQLSYVYYSVAAIKVILTIGLIQWAGLVGAAFSALLASVFVPVGIYSLAKKYFSFQIEWQRLGRLSVIVLPSIGYALFVAGGFSLPLLVRVFWIGVTLLLIFFSCFSFSERRAVFSLLGTRVR